MKKHLILSLSLFCFSHFATSQTYDITIGDPATNAAAALKLNENPTNGTNTIGFRSPDALAANYLFTLPVDYGTSGFFLRTDGAGTLSWQGGSGLFTAGTGLSWSGTTLNSVWTQNGNDIYNNNSGNVGIGASPSPARKLTVQRAAGAGSISDIWTSDGTQWTAINSNSSAGSWTPLAQAGDHTIVFSNSAAETGGLVLAQWSASSKGIRIASDGNVGIGLAAPTSSKLQVAGFVSGDDGNGRFSTKWSGDNHHGIWYRATVSADGNTVTTADAITFREYGSTALGYHFWTGGTSQTERFRITNDYAAFLTGNVGVGSAAPGFKLDVFGDARIGETAARHYLKISSSSYGEIRYANATYNEEIRLGLADGGSYGALNGDWYVYSGAVNRMDLIMPRLGGVLLANAGGNVAIGTTAPVAKLDVRGAATINNSSNYANTNNYMASGSLTVGGISTNYGGGTGWTANTAGILMEAADNTEIGIHDSGTRVASAMYFQGAAVNRITIGRDMGWGTTPLAVATLAGTGTRFVVADANGVLSAGSSTSAGIVTGSGTLNYIPKWTPNGSTLGNSLFTDDGTTITSNGQLDVTGGTGTGYTTAPIEIRTSAIAPRLAFHYSGVVASQIAVENSGRIAIRDNPGTGYENFVAKNITSTETLVIGTTVPTINGYSPANQAIRMTPNFHLNSMGGNAVIVNWDNGTTGATQTFRIGNGAGSDVFYVYADGQAYTTNWWRSLGNTGWYSQSYGGGIWMDQSTYVRVYNNKGFTAIGNVGIGTDSPDTKLDVHGKATISRDGATECCGNDASLALAESTSGTGRRASISFHNGGEAEGTLRLIQNAVGSVNTSSRRIQLFDNQSQGMGLEFSGGLFYGNNNSRSQTRNDAGLRGDAGAQSGFYENNGSTLTNYPSMAGQSVGSWAHLLDVRHSNPANNYAMQFAGSFYDQDVWLRKTNNNAAQSWTRITTSRDISYAKNEYYGVAGPNAWNYVTGYSAWMDVRAGDKIKFDGMYYGRLTGGSNNDYFYTNVEITGQNGCGNYNPNQHDYFHTNETGSDHDNFKPVPYMDVWDCPCTGQIRFRLMIYMGGDDNWEAREMIITGTRY